MSITPEIVKNFYDYMTQQVRATVQNKNSSTFMTVVGSVLESVGSINKSVFLNEYATTIFRTIYVPFEVGVASECYPLWDQCLILVHECQHVIQCNRVGNFEYAFRYLTDTSKRTAYEVDGYSSEMEVNWWYTHEILDPSLITTYLQSYSLTDTDIDVAHEMLTSRAIAIQAGAPAIAETSRTAIPWLMAHVGRL